MTDYRIIQLIPDTATSVVDAPNGTSHRVIAWAVVERQKVERVPVVLTDTERDPSKTVPHVRRVRTVEALVDPDEVGLLVPVSSLVTPPPSDSDDVDPVHVEAMCRHVTRESERIVTDDVVVEGRYLAEEDRVTTARYVPHRVKYRLPRHRAESLGVPFTEIGRSA